MEQINESEGLKFIKPRYPESTMFIQNLHGQFDRDDLLGAIREIQGTGIEKVVVDVFACPSDKMKVLKRDIEGMCSGYGLKTSYVNLRGISLQ